MSSDVMVMTNMMSSEGGAVAVAIVVIVGSCGCIVTETRSFRSCGCRLRWMRKSEEMRWRGRRPRRCSFHRCHRRSIDGRMCRRCQRSNCRRPYRSYLKSGSGHRC